MSHQKTETTQENHFLAYFEEAGEFPTEAYKNKSRYYHGSFRRFWHTPKRPDTIPNFELIREDLTQHKLSYADLEALWIIHDDYIDGIITDKNTTKTPPTYTRNAKKATALKDRLPSNHFAHQVTNTLLRALNTLRGIDFVLDQIVEPESLIEKLKLDLKEAYIALIENVETLSKKSYCYKKNRKLKMLHQAFNSILIDILNQSGLDKGIEYAPNPQAFYHELLMHYRNLANIIEPAAAVETTSMINDKTFTQLVEPITQKTPKQKQAIDNALSYKTTESFHSQQSTAIQIANKAFAERLKSDDTQLGAQTRFKIPHGVKHAFLETTQYNRTNMQTIRTSAISAMARGMTDKERQKATDQNLQQIVEFIEAKDSIKEAKKIEYALLLERSTLRKTGCNISQKALVDLARQATVNNTSKDTDSTITNDSGIAVESKVPIGFSGMPMSVFAMATKAFNPIVLSEGLSTESKIKERINQSLLQSLSSRTHEIADIISSAKSQNGLFFVYGCASNVNRASAVSLTLAGNLISNNTLSFQKATDEIIKTGHETFVGTLTCSGSRGLKQASHQKGLFSKLASKFVYGGCSKSRTQTPIDPDVAFETAEKPRSLKVMVNKENKLVLKPYLKTFINAHLQQYLSLRTAKRIISTRQLKIDAVTQCLNQLKSIEEDDMNAIELSINTLSAGNKKAKNSPKFFKSGNGLLDEIIQRINAEISKTRNKIAQRTPPTP